MAKENTLTEMKLKLNFMKIEEICLNVLACHVGLILLLVLTESYFIGSERALNQGEGDNGKSK